MNIVKVEDVELKKQISGKVLNKLPEWFGIPESTKEYIEESSVMNF